MESQLKRSLVWIWQQKHIYVFFSVIPCHTPFTRLIEWFVFLPHKASERKQLQRFQHIEKTYWAVAAFIWSLISKTIEWSVWAREQQFFWERSEWEPVKTKKTFVSLIVQKCVHDSSGIVSRMLPSWTLMVVTKQSAQVILLLLLFLAVTKQLQVHYHHPLDWYDLHLAPFVIWHMGMHVVKSKQKSIKSHVKLSLKE